MFHVLSEGISTSGFPDSQVVWEMEGVSMRRVGRRGRRTEKTYRCLSEVNMVRYQWGSEDGLGGWEVVLGRKWEVVGVENVGKG